MYPYLIWGYKIMISNHFANHTGILRCGREIEGCLCPYPRKPCSLQYVDSFLFVPGPATSTSVHMTKGSSSNPLWGSGHLVRRAGTCRRRRRTLWGNIISSVSTSGLLCLGRHGSCKTMRWPCHSCLCSLSYYFGAASEKIKPMSAARPLCGRQAVFCGALC